MSVTRVNVVALDDPCCVFWSLQQKSYTGGVYLCSVLSVCREQMSLGRDLIRPQGPLSRDHLRHIAAVPAVVVEPVYWVIKCAAAASKQVAGGADADSAGSVLSDQISDRDAVR